MINCPGCGETMDYSQKENNPVLYCPWCKFKVTIEQTGTVQTKEQFIRKATKWIENEKKSDNPFSF